MEANLFPASHLDTAALAGRGEGLDRALEAVKGVRVSTGHGYPGAPSYSSPHTLYRDTFDALCYFET